MLMQKSIRKLSPLVQTLSDLRKDNSKKGDNPSIELSGFIGYSNIGRILQ